MMSSFYCSWYEEIVFLLFPVQMMTWAASMTSTSSRWPTIFFSGRVMLSANIIGVWRQGGIEMSITTAARQGEKQGMGETGRCEDTRENTHSTTTQDTT